MDFSETVRAVYNRIVEPYLAQRHVGTPDVRLLDRLVDHLFVLARRRTGDGRAAAISARQYGAG